MPVRFSLHCSLAISLLLSAAPLWGQSPQSAFAAPPFTASTQSMQSAAALVPHEKDTDITMLLEENRFSFDTAGRLTVTQHWIYRMETTAGVHAWSVVGSQWEPWLQSRPQVEARVIDAQGHAYTLDPKTLGDSPAYPQEQDTFEDERVYQAPLPGIAVGAIVEERITSTDNQPYSGAGNMFRIRFGLPGVPVTHTRLILEAPETLPLRYKTHLLPDVTAEKEKSGGRITLTFAQDNTKAAAPATENLPPDAPAFPQVEFSTADSWQNVAEGYARLAEPAIRSQDVSFLVSSAAALPREQKITELLTILHKNVRYTGIEFGFSQLTPQPPAATLARHYGDCKDKATLLVSMLRAAKIPAYVALLSTGPGQDINPDLPGLGRFNHAIVYVPGAPDHSADLWLDATDSYATRANCPAPTVVATRSSSAIQART